MADRAHWDRVYEDKPEAGLSWFEAAPGQSGELIAAHLRPGAAVDVGAGASRLADYLLDAGFGRVTALDISDRALAVSRARLGARAAAVDSVAGDVTRWRPPRRYGLWHDRAVFHVLTVPADRAACLDVLDAAAAPGAVAVLGTFAADGPETGSGLPVRRYAPQALVAEVAAHLPGVFACVESRTHLHLMPAGRARRFRFTVLHKAG